MTRLKELGRRAVVPLLALVTALLFGAVVIILTDFVSLAKIGTDPVGAITGAVGGVVAGYGALLSGAFGDPVRILTAFETGNAEDIATAIRPLHRDAGHRDALDPRAAWPWRSRSGPACSTSASTAS